MRESDGKMVFIPDRLDVKKGEQVRFILRNNGALKHEFLLATTAENLKHAEAMKKYPEMEHDEPNGAKCEWEERGDRVAFQQGRQVRIRLSDPRASGGRHAWHDRCEVKRSPYKGVLT